MANVISAHPIDAFNSGNSYYLTQKGGSND